MTSNDLSERRQNLDISFGENPFLASEKESLMD
jgi:hypothetical protein